MPPPPPPERLCAIDAIILDCDGVLTPGELFYDEHGPRMLCFNARDGFAIAAFTRNAGLRMAVLSGRPVDIATARLKELGVSPLVGSCADKAKGLLEICAGWGIAADRCAYVGDDLPDLRAFTKAGLKIAVADAAPELLAKADWVTTKGGGCGAVREICEAILKARGDWQRLVQRCGG